MKSKISLILVTGFLGSGKTSFLLKYLEAYSEGKKIAIVQNEFAQSNIDGDILKKSNQSFVLKELNRGSIFCRCLFSSFKDTLAELVTRDIDAVLIEATGIADPIGIAQVMEDQRIKECFYLEKIITLVDSCRFLNALENIIGVRHQIEVADYILINKIDLIDKSQVEEIKRKLVSINPLAKLLTCSYGKFSPLELSEDSLPKVVTEQISGDLTRCGEGNYISRVFTTSEPVTLEQAHAFLESLNDEILRVKGYVCDKYDNSFILQYIPGQTTIMPCDKKIGRTELISIGFKEPDFSILQ